ncbi:MAG: hypothetical protein HFJ01_11095 [Lachnospiraceae bacterium]|nr:hypothetical protein [Parablautia intestinalis]MCI8615614.1 hypothetical protein [Lachnospiraceae bacterium]
MKSDIKRVWNIVTSLENYQWRSELTKIEIVNKKQFIAYTKDGFAATFTITVLEPYWRWEFDIFCKAFLKKQQELYVSDLKKAI